jgi:outer membrane lipoprotein-sorting protein
MNDVKRILFSTLAIVLFFGAVSEANAQGTLREVYKRMDAAYANLSSMKANVTMEKKDAQLGEVDTYEGKVLYVPKKGKDANIKVEWEKPSRESLVVKDGKYILYKHSTNQALTGSVSDAKGSSKADSSLAFLNMNTKQLKANYDVQLAAEEKVASGDATWHLILTPKAKSRYKQADLWVSSQGYPVQSKLTETNNDSTTILLSSLDPNAKIDLAEFTLKLPKTVAWVGNK